MKVSRFKKLLSYFYEIPIEKTHSEYSGNLEVSLHQGEWKLSTTHAIYSFGKHYTSYKIAFQKLQIKDYDIKNVLILGVGLGSVVRLLDQQKSIESIVAIDIDPKVIQLAQKYWPNISKKLKTTFHTIDAIQWLKKNQKAQKFDLIISDIFIDMETPESVATSEYLSLLSPILNHNGILIYSRLNYKDYNKADNEKFEQTFFKVFPASFIIPADYNKMYIHRK
ncbi:MAG TPA: fused MFS/spermidine synthase [Chitinophagales bacterium]|nr:fused MFS/spermidine synthase [Chitinophagales bacterium]